MSVDNERPDCFGKVHKPQDVCFDCPYFGQCIPRNDGEPRLGQFANEDMRVEMVLLRSELEAMEAKYNKLKEYFSH